VLDSSLVPLRTSEAFIIDVHKMREADRLVVLFTEDEGKVRGVAASAARSHKRFGGRLERLSRVRATWFEKEGRELARLDVCELLDGSFALYQDLRVAMLLGYMAEVVDTFSREREPDPLSFRLLRSMMDALRAGADPGVLARYFEVWTLRLHGLMPAMDACGACGRDLSGGAFVDPAAVGEVRCAACRPRGARGAAGRLSPEALRALDRFRRLGPLEAARGGATAGALAEMEDFAGAVLGDFVGRPFRSSRFLRETLREVEPT
jgi:DNA repair protein RecO (recombination protein O)